MFSIRNGMFETNSSSTHVLVMMKTSDFRAWYKNEDEFDSLEDIVFWNRYESGQSSDSQKFKTGRELIEEMKAEDFKDISRDDLFNYAQDNDYFTYEKTVQDMEDDYVTEGDITAFSYSGWD